METLELSTVAAAAQRLGVEEQLIREMVAQKRIRVHNLVHFAEVVNLEEIRQVVKFGTPVT